jgi:hypothetical protein
MADIEQSEIDYTLLKINRIMEAMNNDDQLSVLNETDLLLKFLHKNKAVNPLEKEISILLLDPDKMRIIKLLKELKKDIDLSTEYYDIDRGNDDKLFYKKDIEKAMLLLNDRIRSFLSEIIKEKIGETKI